MKYSLTRLLLLPLVCWMCVQSKCENPQESYWYTVANTTDHTLAIHYVTFKQTADTTQVYMLPPHTAEMLFYFEFDGSKKGVSDIHPKRITAFKLLEAYKADGTQNTTDLLQRDKWDLNDGDIEARYTLNVTDADF